MVVPDMFAVGGASELLISLPSLHTVVYLIQTMNVAQIRIACTGFVFVICAASAIK